MSGGSARREVFMKRCVWIAGAALLGVWTAAPVARAQNQPPAPPAAAGAPAVVPPVQAAPGRTSTGALAPAPPVALPGVTTVMVFPFENNSPSGGRALGEAIADAVRRGMEASRIYSTTSFSPDSLLIQRAQQEAGTSAPDLADALNKVIDPVKGAVDQARAMKIASRTGMQALLLGYIEDYKYDPAAHKVDLVGSAQILNAQTGEPMRNAAATATATGSAGQDENAVASMAATELANKLLSGLSVPPPPAGGARVTRKSRRHIRTQEEEGSRHRIPGWIPAGILLGIVIGATK
jgi:hypothetical protein